MLKKTFSFILFSVFLFSCKKNEQFPSTPNIEFKDFLISGDSGRLIFSFEDGEGDIGLSDEQNQNPYDNNSYYYHNLFLEYYEKNDEFGWQPGYDLNGDSIVFKIRLKPIYTGKEKSLSGEMDVEIEPIFYNPFSGDNDTIMYKVILIDRALNISNVIETKVIIR